MQYDILCLYNGAAILQLYNHFIVTYAIYEVFFILLISVCTYIHLPLFLGSHPILLDLISFSCQLVIFMIILFHYVQLKICYLVPQRALSLFFIFLFPHHLESLHILGSHGITCSLLLEIFHFLVCSNCW